MKVSRKITHGVNHHKKKLIAASISGVSILMLSSTVVFAQSDLATYLETWYAGKLQAIEQYLTTSITADAIDQKAELIRKVREDAEQSVSNLEEYARDKEAEVENTLEEKENEAFDTIKDVNDQQLEQAKDQIDDSTEQDKEEIENAFDEGAKPEDTQKEEVPSETPQVNDAPAPDVPSGVNP